MIDDDIKEDAWEFVKTGLQTLGLSDERLHDYADVIAQLMQSAVDRDRARATDTGSVK